MKRIAVVAGEKEYAEYLTENLSLFLGEFAEIRAYCRQEVEKLTFFEEEYVAVSAFTQFQHVKEKVSAASEMVILSLALTKENVKHLEALPMKTRALLVNLDYRTCMQVITNLYSVGFRDLELVPYYGEGDYDKSIDLAITADEEQNVPPGISRIINIGQRSIDLSCIVDLADRLGVEDVLRRSESFKLKKNQYFSNDSMEKILGENLNLVGRIEGLLKVMKQGILLTDLMGGILLSNEKASLLLKTSENVINSFNATDVLPDIDLTEAQNDREQLIRVGDQTLVAVVTELCTERKKNGAIITIDNFEELEDKQHGIRARLNKAPHVAKYHFEDIKGSSEVLAETVAVAGRMAKSDSSVLIMGESGTGKELFAQSIHNESGRCKYNFVAINCAAIPENLLESELFGYEEGAFTGAKKGGKIGYLELAHRGTIFLDEIAEMPIMLQSKLLRAIEERKIIRIGSQKVVDVDVRILTATNRDLYAEVKKGTFREDLYYRLNVLPINIPPLRERPEDVELLLEHFMRNLNMSCSLTEEAMALLREYPWEGNVRELRNAVEYMASQDKEIIGTCELPPLMRRWKAESHKSDSQYIGEAFLSKIERGDNEQWEMSESASLANSEDSITAFLLREGRNLQLFGFVLSALAEANERHEHPGRAALQKMAESRNLFYSEAEVRAALRKLDECGYVLSARGRGGSRITQRGRQLENRIIGLIG